MLALLNYVQSLLGKRNLIAFLVLAALSATALELTMLARNAFETFIQKQAATFAEQKAKGEADVATATAREKEAQAQLAAEVAANAKFRQLAEAQLAGAGAREKEFQAQLAAEIAANAKFRQAAEAQLAQASAREKEAMAFNAREVARNSPERQRAEALKASADADAADSNAAIQRTLRNIITGEVATPQGRMRTGIKKAFGGGDNQNDPTQGVRELSQRTYENAMNDLGMGDDPPARKATPRPNFAGAFEAKIKALNRAIDDDTQTDEGAKSFGELTNRSYEALHYRVNGDKPTAARDKQIEEDCKRRLAGFASMKGHAAIAVTPNNGCSWTAGQPTKQAAVAVVMNQCAKANVRTCSIAFAR